MDMLYRYLITATSQVTALASVLVPVPASVAVVAECMGALAMAGSVACSYVFLLRDSDPPPARRVQEGDQ